MSAEQEEIWCDCSDDEKYNPAKYKKGTWEPKPEDILKIFEEIKTKKVLELQWKCPGRRSPDSDKKREEDVKEEPKEEEKEEERKPEVTQFDFDDDGPDPKAVLTPRRTPGSAPKSEKKVARMDKIFKDVMYQRKLQAAEKEARKLALSKSPRSLGSPARSLGSPARAPGSPARALGSPARAPGSPGRMQGSPGRVRLGSPAGSPRTPPVYSANSQSPVRMMGPGDGLVTTPLRAPISEDTVIRTTISETIKASSPCTEASVLKETVPREVTPSVNVSETASVGAPGPVSVERTELPGEIIQEKSKIEETVVVSTYTVTPSVVTSDVSNISDCQRDPAPVPSTPVSETVTQTSRTTTPTNQDKNNGPDGVEDKETT